MKSKDRLLWVAMGGLLLVGAFMVGILAGLPGGDRLTVRAQESTTPTPLPQPTGEDMDRWEREWDARGREGLQSMVVTSHDAPMPESEGGASGASGTSTNVFIPSQPGDRELRFRDGTTLTLPDGVDLVRTGGDLVTLPHTFWAEVNPTLDYPLKDGQLESYHLRKGEHAIIADSISPDSFWDGDVSEFPFLTATTTQD